MTIADLLVNIGFTSDKNKLDDFVGSLGKLNLTSIAAAFGFGSLAAIMEKFTKESVQAAEATNTLASRTGLDPEKLDRYTRAFGRMGIDAKSTQSLISSLFDMQTEAITKGGAAAEAFQTLNIDYHTDLFTLIDKVQEKLKDPSYSARTKTILSDMVKLNDQEALALKRSEKMSEFAGKTMALNKRELETGKGAALWGSDVITNIGTFFKKLTLEALAVGGFNEDQNKKVENQLGKTFSGQANRSGDWDKLKNFLFGEPVSAEAFRVGIPLSGSKTITNNTYISVDATNKDAVGIANEVDKHMKKIMSDADRQSNTVEQ